MFNMERRVLLVLAMLLVSSASPLEQQGTTAGASLLQKLSHVEKALVQKETEMETEMETAVAPAVQGKVALELPAVEHWPAAGQLLNMMMVSVMGKHSASDEQTPADGEKATVGKVPAAHRTKVFIQFAFEAVLILIVAAIYNKYRNTKLFPQQGRRAASPSGFTFGLFSCFDDVKLCLFSCCCPIIRWSDTNDKAGIMAYWQAIGMLMFCGFMASGLAFTASVGSTCLMAIFVLHRQKLRTHFGMKSGEGGDSLTCVEDFCTYLFCAPCAIIQEAREVELMP